MKILITTQYQENYGTDADPYWKMKGGSDYFITGVDPLRVAPGLLVDKVRDRIEYQGVMSQEYIVDWRLVDDDYVTDFERDQMQYDGRVTHPTPILTPEIA